MNTVNLVLVLFIFQVGNLSAHTDTIPDKGSEIEHRYGISVRFSVPAITGYTLDAFISPELNAELTVAPQYYGFGGGLYYHFWPRGYSRNWNPCLGIKYGYAGRISSSDWFGGTGRVSYYKSSVLYFPVGVCLSPNRWFNFAIDGGFARLKEYDVQHKFLMSIKFGVRIKYEGQLFKKE